MDYQEWYDWNEVDGEEGYYDPFQPGVEGGFVSPGNVFGMDTDTVVVASVMYAGKHVDLRAFMITLGQDPGRKVQSRERCHMCQTWVVSWIMVLRGPRRCPEMRRTCRFSVRIAGALGYIGTTGLLC